MRRNTSVTGPVGAGIAYRPSAFVTAPNAVPVMDTLTPAIGSLVVADVTRPVIWRCCADAPATPTSVASASVSRRMRVTTIPPEGIPRSSRHGRTNHHICCRANRDPARRGTAGLDSVLERPYSGYQAAPFTPRAHASSRESSMVIRGCRFLTFVALAAALYAVPAFAQNGRISGVVRGTGGLPMSGAAVRATNQRTSATSRTTTAADGSYTVADLTPGTYIVSASLPGLRTVSKDVQVAAGATVSLDVEVLRGPQGTLFGAGSLGGTVRYISNQPELNVNSTFGEAEINAIDGGAPGNNAKLGFNVPLGDKAAFRVAGYSNRLGGWMDAVQPNLTVNHAVNGGERSGVRVALKVVPSGRFSFTPRVVYPDVKMDGWNRIDAFNILANPYTTTRPAVTLGPRQLFTQLEEPFTDKFLLTDLNLKYDLAPGVSLTSITSYVHRDVLVVRDATALTGSVTGGSYGVSEDLYTLDAPLHAATTSSVWTRQLRLP